MAFTLRIRADDKEDFWPISSTCLTDLHTLQQTGVADEVTTLWGETELPAGVERKVDRQALIEAVSKLWSKAKLLPPGFEIVASRVIRGTKVELGGSGGGLSGLKIGGKFFSVDCDGRGWRMRRVGKNVSDSDLPPEMRNVLRFDPAVIETENMGNVELRLRKGKNSVLVRLLSEISEFLQDVPDDNVYVTVG